MGAGIAVKVRLENPLRYVRTSLARTQQRFPHAGRAPTTVGTVEELS